MTGRRYALEMLAAFVGGLAVITGGVFTLLYSKRLQEWFGDGAFKAMRTDIPPELLKGITYHGGGAR